MASQKAGAPGPSNIGVSGPTNSRGARPIKHKQLGHQAYLREKEATQGMGALGPLTKPIEKQGHQAQVPDPLSNKGIMPTKHQAYHSH